MDKDGIIRDLQTVPEVASEPDYDAVLATAREFGGIRETDDTGLKVLLG